MIDEALSTQLQHTAMSAESGCPLYVPRPGVAALHAHATLLQNHANMLGEDAGRNEVDSFLAFINVLNALK